MSDMQQLMVDSASRLFSDLCTNATFEAAEKCEMPPDLWPALERAGFANATLSESRGGSGADLGDALAVIREAGFACLPAPLAEKLLAEMLLATAGLPPRTGVVTIAPVISTDCATLTRKNGAWELSGTLHRVPWGRHANSIVVLAQVDGQWATAVLDSEPPSQFGVNYANEPRDTIEFNSVRLNETAVAVGGGSFSGEDLRFHGALFRLNAMVGALSRILGMTVEYALQREQFGRPIGKFQAVQHQIAIMASQVAAAIAAADAVSGALRHGSARFEIAAAKARIGEAAGIAAGIAHQVHGAMGFSHEHTLHRSTRRLWSWRDEFGSDADWAAWVGNAVAKLGGDGLWPFLTSAPKVASRI